MSKTIVDFPKVTQMLDGGHRVCIFKNPLGSYTAQAHVNQSQWERARDGCLAKTPEDVRELVRSTDWDEEGVVTTDDFTPEQSLTRLAYKVHGEIIGWDDSPVSDGLSEEKHHDRDD